MSNLPTLAELTGDARSTWPETFVAARYPHTYANDFLVANPHVIPAQVWDGMGHDITDDNGPLSRGQAARIREDWARRRQLDVDSLSSRLADAYLRINGIEKPS